MKTTKNYIVVFLTILLSHLSSFAQYNGGDSAGSTTQELGITLCGIPPNFNAYFGGDNDGSTADELSNTMCGIPPSTYAYLGGDNDGATVDELAASVCGIPPSYFAYMGGDNDGAATDETITGVCSFPPSFYAYFGGDNDGAVVDSTAPICPTAAPVASFTASATSICVGQSVTFTDTSTNIPSAWTWTFTGGTPNNAIVQNPVITYNTAGSYAVTLVAANYNGADSEIIAGYITVTAFPTVTSTTPASRCGAGIVTLEATVSAGTLSWYANPSGGTALATGTSFTTPSISATTSYYVEAVNGVCSSARTLVNATINAIPTIISTTPNSRCGAGSVILGATASVGGGIPFWYASPTGGTALASTNSFTTPNISITTTFYVEASNVTCTSSPRIPVIATINTLPAVLSTIPASRCDSGTVLLEATASAGTLSWFAVSSGGTTLATTSSFTTPSIATTTTYYVEASTGTCISARIAVTATVNVTPVVTGTSNSRCDAGTVILSAAASAGTLSWYANPTGGSALGTGTSFTTPSISITTTFYVEALNGSCTSGTRIAVVATINNSPTITSTTAATICGGDTFTISAIADTGSLAWYNAPTGGIIQGTGNSFSLSNWFSTTTFYVQSTNGSCQSDRIPVLVTVIERPFNTTISPASRCDSGTVILGATYTVGTINWYANSSGGSPIASGASFTTPSISTTTTYYVEAVNNGCISSIRTAITATINNVVITSAIPGSRCNTGTVTLSATASTGNTVWFNVSSGGTALATTNSFTTPSISTTTTYYVEASSGTCISERIAVIATVNSVAAPTGNANQTFCNAETVGLLVTTSGTNIVWYNASTNGAVVPNETILVSGTTYYASQNDGVCESSSRLSVTVTLGTCLGIDQFVFNQIKLYPNPVTDMLSIISTVTISEVTLVDMLGRILFTTNVNDIESKINMSNLPVGTYLVNVSIDNALKTFKVIKR